MSQTSYSQYQGGPFSGMLADNSGHEVETGINMEASASIPFGRFVAWKTGAPDDKGAKLPAASTDILKGVVMHAHHYAPVWTDRDSVVHGELDGTGLVPGATLEVLRRGRIYMESETAFAYGDPVFVRYSANGGNTKLGIALNAADAGHTIDLTSKCRYVSSGLAGAVACIEILKTF